MGTIRRTFRRSAIVQQSRDLRNGESIAPFTAALQAIMSRTSASAPSRSAESSVESLALASASLVRTRATNVAASTLRPVKNLGTHAPRRFEDPPPSLRYPNARKVARMFQDVQELQAEHPPSQAPRVAAT